MALGVRYADRIVPRPEDPSEVSQLSRRVEDPMANERFDVELNVVYERNSRVDEYGVNMGSCAAGRYVTEDLGGAMTGNTCGPANAAGISPYIIEADAFLPATLPGTLVIPHNWRDSLSIRLGGDYNVMPGLASSRLALGSTEVSGYSVRTFRRLSRAASVSLKRKSYICASSKFACAASDVPGSAMVTSLNNRAAVSASSAPSARWAAWKSAFERLWHPKRRTPAARTSLLSCLTADPI